MMSSIDFGSPIARFECSPNVYALLVGSASDLHSNATFQDYFETICSLDDEDPLSLDLLSLHELYQETSNDAMRGFLLAAMEFAGGIACFGAGGRASAEDARVFQFASEQVISAFSVAFMEMLDFINPMVADADQLLELTEAADDEISRGYCVGAMYLRSEYSLITGKIDQGLEIDAALSQVPGLFAQSTSPVRHALAS
jgi:hypothetical protein